MTLNDYLPKYLQFEETKSSDHLCVYECTVGDIKITIDQLNRVVERYTDTQLIKKLDINCIVRCHGIGRNIHTVHKVIYVNDPHDKSNLLAILYFVWDCCKWYLGKDIDKEIKEINNPRYGWYERTMGEIYLHIIQRANKIRSEFNLVQYG